MDAKALAKSKRAHSLHHKKKHPAHQGLKVPSAGSDDKKAAGKQAKERPQQAHGQQIKERNSHNQGSKALPSNWDRYDDELDLASKEAQGSSSQPTEFVLPKSKGAGYAYLISEAKAQSQLQYSSDVSPLFDDFISDFTQDFGPMLAAKGQSMLSWTTDDSFEFESNTSTSIEAPFLSINLNSLAEQLAKAKLSERLYLQSDVVPLEMLDDVDRQHSPATETGDRHVQTSEEESKSVQHHSVEISQSLEINTDTSPVSEKPPIFEATSAEAELDLLLNSFSETTIVDSSGASLTGTAPTVNASGESGNRMMNRVSKPADIGDAIDSLLEETSIAGDEQISFATKARSESVSSSIPKSNVVDDFDSWLDTI